MNGPIRFSGYGVGTRTVTIMHSAITHWYPIDYNGNLGTTIVLSNGDEITVGQKDWEVTKMMEEKA